MNSSNSSNENLGKEAPEAFSPPRHWSVLEELKPEYWNNAEDQEKRAQEFLHKPIETIAAIDGADKAGINRRDFLTVMGASMAMASFSCARRPVHKIIPYVVRPEEIVPGIATHYASVCGGCSEGCGIVAKTREGRPVKLEGNPDHPINGNSLCARGHASLLNLYDPARAKAPLSLTRKGDGTPTPWQDLDSAVSKALAQSSKVRVLSRYHSGLAHRKLVNQFLAAYGGGAWIEYEPSALDSSVEANEISYGSDRLPEIRLERAQTILSLGADFLGTWGNTVELSRAFSKNRKLDSSQSSRASMSKLYVFESGFSVTGANADRRFAVRPGDEYSIVMAVLNYLIVEKGRSSYTSNAALTKVLREFAPESVSKEIGKDLNVHAVEEIGEELWRNRGQSAVLAGGIPSQSVNSLALHVAVNLLNSILDNDGKVFVDPGAAEGKSLVGDKGLRSLVEEMKQGQVEVLIIHGVNPVYELPSSLNFVDALSKVKTVVSVTDRLDETAKYSDYFAPEHHYLENWGDSNPRDEIYGLQQPTISPIHDTRSFEDSLIMWGKLSGKSQMTGIQDWYSYLRETWKDKLYPKHGNADGFENFWENSLRKGGVFGSKSSSRARVFRAGAVSSLRSREKLVASDLYLGAYEKVSMGDGRSASNAWLQEMPDPISTATWDNYLNMSPETATKYRLETNDVVRVETSGDRFVEVPVLVQPGLHANTVTLAAGYGREASGPVGNKVGANVIRLAQFSQDQFVLNGLPVKVSKTGKRYQIALTQGHHRTENRPVVNDITLAEFRKNPATENHTDPHLRPKEVVTIWSQHDYSKGYRWGMSIDLSSCTGCGACVIACQAENNIPVVGRDRVRMGREMHWIRIDRYYSGEASSPEVIFQPMLCQHCENAPCETVCPVLATVHNTEGLNEMVYNRCVGTRYCQNNCPYKVRRFNFFDHWKDYSEEMNLVWNPDVTVRSRGVMEKCTFCVQRIERARSVSKDEKRKIRDQDLKTACQQTCPTDAIVFGNINDPKTEVSTIQKDARAFRSLEDLNTRPSIVYLTKVRNSAGGHKDGHA